MPKLYYALEVWDTKELGRGKKFRLESNFPFPSPLGTEMFISDGHGDGMFVNVVSYKHVIDNDEKLSHFYMVLGADEKSGFLDPRCGTDPACSIPEELWQALIEAGWEEGYRPSK